MDVTHPLLIESIVRARVYESLYWKATCVTLTAASLVDEALKLRAVACQVLSRPAPFVCLLLKLLHLHPEPEIIDLYLACEHTYLVALAALYVRFTYPAVAVFTTLEPLLLNRRKLRIQSFSGDYTETFIDVFVDNLLREERVAGFLLPRIPTRITLEKTGKIPPRVSPLEVDLDLDNIDLGL